MSLHASMQQGPTSSRRSCPRPQPSPEPPARAGMVVACLDGRERPRQAVLKSTRSGIPICSCSSSSITQHTLLQNPPCPPCCGCRCSRRTPAACAGWPRCRRAEPPPPSEPSCPPDSASPRLHRPQAECVPPQTERCGQPAAALWHPQRPVRGTDGCVTSHFAFLGTGSD